MPIRRAVRATRQAISPRLAIRILSNIAAVPRRYLFASVVTGVPSTEHAFDALHDRAHEAPQLWDQPDRKDDKYGNDDQRNHWIREREIDQGSDEQVLSKRRRPIGKGLR